MRQPDEDLRLLPALQICDPDDRWWPGLVERLRRLRVKIGYDCIRPATVVVRQQLALIPGLNHDTIGTSNREFDTPLLQPSAQQVASDVQALGRYVGVVSYVPDKSSLVTTCVQRANTGIATGDSLIYHLRLDF